MTTLPRKNRRDTPSQYVHKFIYPLVEKAYGNRNDSKWLSENFGVLRDIPVTLITMGYSPSCDSSLGSKLATPLKGLLVILQKFKETHQEKGIDVDYYAKELFSGESIRDIVEDLMYDSDFYSDAATTDTTVATDTINKATVPEIIITEAKEMKLPEKAERTMLDDLKIIHKYNPYLLNFKDIITRVPHSEILDVIRWLHENGIDRAFSTRTMDWAASIGRLDIVRWLDQNRKEGCTTEAMDLAAIGGYHDVVEWLHNNRKEGCTQRAMNWAAERGDLPLLVWLHKHRKEGCTTDAMDYAARNGRFLCLKFLHEIDAECTEYAMDYAARGGHLSCLEFLHEIGKKCTTAAMDFAAGNGHLEVVEFLHKNRTEGCTELAMEFAISSGHIQVVEWLKKNYPSMFSTWSEHAIEYAAKSSKMDMVKYIYLEAKDTIKPQCLMHAFIIAINKSAEMAKWIYTNTPISLSQYEYELAIRDATVKGNLETIKWLYETVSQKYTGSKWSLLRIILCFSVYKGNLDVIKWVCENIDITEKDFPNDSLAIAVHNGNLDVIKWYREKSFFELDFQDKEMLDIALIRWHPGIIEWFWNEKTIHFPKDIMDRAISNKQYQTAKWLYDVGAASGCSQNTDVSRIDDISFLRWIYEYCPFVGIRFKFSAQSNEDADEFKRLYISKYGGEKYPFMYYRQEGLTLPEIEFTLCVPTCMGNILRVMDELVPARSDIMIKTLHIVS